jgi:hypothetical protein
MQLLSCVHPTHKISKTTIPVDAAFRLQIARSVEDLKGGDHLDGHREHREPHMPTGVFFNVSCVHPCPPKQRNASMEPWQAELLSVVQEYRS